MVRRKPAGHYNHFGPVGNRLSAYAPQFFTARYKTPWGDAINYDGSDSGPVREFFIHNALYWLDEYCPDGLRLDAVHAIQDTGPKHVVAQLAERVRKLATAQGREIHLVLENEANRVDFLERARGGPRWCTAQWNDDVHHCLHVAATGETSGYYEDYADPRSMLGRGLTEGFVYQGEPSVHPEFASPTAREAIPDPNDVVTFEMARLEWSELEDPRHSQCLEWYRAILALRRKTLRSLFHRAPTSSTFTLLGSGGLRVSWRFEHSVELCLVANLSNEQLNQIPRPAGEIIFAHGAKADERTHTMQLDPWAVLWCLSSPDS